MNILALTSVYPQSDDGKDIVTPTVKYFCEKWAESGHNVIVVHNNSCFPVIFYYLPNRLRRNLSSKLGHNLPTLESRKKKVVVKNNMSVYRIPITKWIPYSKFSKRQLHKQIIEIRKILDENELVPDVIIGHWMNPQIELLNGLSKFYNAKTSLVFHGDCTQKQIDKFDLKEKILNINAVGCRNKEYADYVQGVLELKRKPFICYSGIPDEEVEKQKKYLRDNPQLTINKEFIYVGRLVKYKKVDTIIKALNIAYPKKDFKLHIVGEGAEKGFLKNLIKNLQMECNVIFHGQINREKVFDIMRKSVCFTMVSESETFGMVYIEAMLAGCVTIGSKKGGIDGVIQDGENGFLSEEGNVKELSDIYKRIEKMNNEEIKQIRKNAIKTAFKFKDSLIAEKYLNDVLNWKRENKCIK